MTTVKNHKEYQFYGEIYFVEKYIDKYQDEWFWRYGYVISTGHVRYGLKISDGLRSRPNLKRLFGS